MNSKDMIFPMTAGDLVASAGVVCRRIGPSGFDTELDIQYVKGIAVDENNGDLLRITFEGQGDFAEPFVLKRSTAILVTDISMR